MTTKISQAFAAFCIATVLTQAILMGYFVTQGALNRDSVTKVVGLLNGINISGNRLQQILREGEDREQPDFDEILEARKMKSYDMDIRLRSQKEFRDDLGVMLSELREERERFDQRLTSFRSELEEIREGARNDGLQDVQRTLQALDPVQSKEQLLIMYDDERIDDVVTIVQAMSTDKRKDILAEFTSREEADKLADILRRIGEGMPISSLINQASDSL
ncbi:MAG: hypothetical protein ACR2NZ_11935 [Rubripirellula sp.]